MTEALVVDDNRQTADALHQMLDRCAGHCYHLR